MRRQRDPAPGVWASLDAEIASQAAAADATGRIADSLVSHLAEAGLLCPCLGPEQGGAGLDPVMFGEFCASVGYACASVRALVTVQDMVAGAIARWGTDAQKARWLPGLGSGERIAAFCLTEPDVGSDAAAVATSFVPDGDAWIVTGTKRYVTFGLRAGLFLIVGRAPDGPVAAILEAGAPGVEVQPMRARSVGLRACELAEVTLNRARVARDAQLAPAGFGVSHVAGTALDRGRYSVACGCAGLAEAALDLAAAYALRRRQFGALLAEHQLTRRKITASVADATAARLTCAAAAESRARGSSTAVLETMLAKYVAGEAAFACADRAVSVHGGTGLLEGSPAERMLRDARVLRTIEGTDDINELAVCELALRTAAARERESSSR